jgi:hypothetical protein
LSVALSTASVRVINKKTKPAFNRMNHWKRVSKDKYASFAGSTFPLLVRKVKPLNLPHREKKDVESGQGPHEVFTLEVS